MAAAILTLDGALDAVFARCREVVRAGGVIAYPTDTFYGLGADPRNREAVKKLFAIKGRRPDQAILLLLSDRSEVGQILVAEIVRLLAGRRSKHAWQPAGTFEIAGHPDPVEALERLSGAARVASTPRSSSFCTR